MAKQADLKYGRSPKEQGLGRAVCRSSKVPQQSPRAPNWETSERKMNREYGNQTICQECHAFLDLVPLCLPLCKDEKVTPQTVNIWTQFLQYLNLLRLSNFIIDNAV